MRNDVIAVLLALALMGSIGCRSEPESALEGDAVLMAVGSQEIGEDEFRRAYRVFRAAYGAEADERPADERASMMRFIQQLSDQLILMEYARESDVAISEDALNRAIEDIRADYPEGLFDQMLLENAINFADWKEALRIRLTIEQLIQKELAAKVRITEEDIAAFYQEQSPGQLAPFPSLEGEGADQVDQLLVQQLRREKTEQAFGPWIEELRARYAVTIDQAVVRNVMADSGLLADEPAETP